MKVLAIILLAGVLAAPRVTYRIPAASTAYRARVIREAHAQGGLSAPVAMFAGQLTQESGFNPAVHSSVGAQGLAQFMPTTAIWLAKVAPKDFSPANSLDPDWSVRALVFYDYWIAARLLMYQAGEERWGAALSGYNGGLGYAQRDAKLGHCTTWFTCGIMVDDGRSQANLKQSRDYSLRILKGYAPLYAAAGWK